MFEYEGSYYTYLIAKLASLKIYQKGPKMYGVGAASRGDDRITRKSYKILDLTFDKRGDYFNIGLQCAARTSYRPFTAPKCGAFLVRTPVF